MCTIVLPSGAYQKRVNGSIVCRSRLSISLEGCADYFVTCDCVFAFRYLDSRCLPA